MYPFVFYDMSHNYSVITGLSLKNSQTLLKGIINKTLSTLQIVKTWVSATIELLIPDVVDF